MFVDSFLRFRCLLRTIQFHFLTVSEKDRPLVSNKKSAYVILRIIRQNKIEMIRKNPLTADFMEHINTVGIEKRKLIQYLNEIQYNMAGRFGIHFSVSKLRPYNRGSEQLNNIRNNLQEALGYLGVEIFILANSDVICIVGDVSMINLERMILKFKKTLSYDPLLQMGMNVESFYRIYNLGTEAHDFRKLIHEIGHKNPLDRIAIDAQDSPLAIPELNIKSGIDTRTFAAIENIFKNADASNFLRRQAIVWVDPDMSLHPMHYQYFLSMQVLQESLNIKESMAGNVWVFKQLSTFFDKMMLNLAKDIINQRSASSIFLNINLRTFATPFFGEYIAKFHKRKELTFEIDILDVMAHFDAFLYAGEFLKQYGFSLCINGFNKSNFHLITPKGIAPYFVKFSVASPLDPHIKAPALVKWLGELNPEKIIFHHCDTIEFVQNGMQYGVNFFQGRGIDGMMKTIQKPV